MVPFLLEQPKIQIENTDILVSLHHINHEDDDNLLASLAHRDHPGNRYLIEFIQQFVVNYRKKRDDLIQTKVLGNWGSSSSKAKSFAQLLLAKIRQGKTLLGKHCRFIQMKHPREGTPKKFLENDDDITNLLAREFLIALEVTRIDTSLVENVDIVVSSYDINYPSSRLSPEDITTSVKKGILLASDDTIDCGGNKLFLESIYRCVQEYYRQDKTRKVIYRLQKWPKLRLRVRKKETSDFYKSILLQANPKRC